MWSSVSYSGEDQNAYNTQSNAEQVNNPGPWTLKTPSM
jgi:hypothetical protein